MERQHEKDTDLIIIKQVKEALPKHHENGRSRLTEQIYITGYVKRV
jgi:hypothetical protein